MTSPVAFAETGVLLRQRRESLGLSQEQAAAQLNLKAVVIRQLESGQWDPQVAPTFIRGYLRHYLRLLKLEETEFLAQFDQQLATLPPASTMHSFSNKASRDAAESRFMLATYFLLVLLIGLFLIWFWQTHMLNEQPVAMLPDSDPAMVSTKPTEVQNAVVIKAPELTPVATAAANPTKDTAVQALPVEPTTNTAPVTESPASQMPAGNDTDAAPAMAAESSLPNVAAANTPAEQAMSAAVTTEFAEALTTTDTNAAASAALTLQLQFSAQCWVAVTDGNGKRLAYNMQNGGQSLTLTGAAPLQVTFGDPTAVTATLSGKTIDLSGYKQGQVVRLTLTGSE